jgi:hypothetical protein
MKELVITKVNGGYIIRFIDGQSQSISVTTNFGAAVKAARQFFDEAKENNVIVVPPAQSPAAA